ncbi:MAG: HD domain-containing protein [Nitrospira sp.]|nr:HD domain-containing protein [Nitrospira sp.]MCP9443395.1 HD domain-containing protein [Nitrospira sp.]
MRTTITIPREPTILKVQRLLAKIDRLELPPASRQEIERMLVRQVAKELDLAMPWKAGHAERTATVACQLGEAFELDGPALHTLALAALLHDIGLLMVPAPSRKRSGPYDPSFCIALHDHARFGANLLEPFAFLKEAALLIAYHHEWWDGSGYPYGIRGPFIPFGARILAVADAFDAIEVPQVRDRSIRDRIALRILRVSAGAQFDPAIVAMLCRLLDGTTHDRALHRDSSPQQGF